MSGGRGQRFWPLSRAARAKQLVRVIGGKTLLELTVERLIPLFPPKNILVVTQQKQYHETARVLEGFGPVRILSEPVGKNTAACVAYASSYVRSAHGDAVLAFLPADHFISDEEGFREVLSAGMDFVGHTGGLLTMGIKPDRPATGFGYIKKGPLAEQAGDLEFYRVSEFTEKPPREVAEAYLKTGEFLWNSGIFTFKASSILSEIETYLPAMAEEFAACEKALGTAQEREALAGCYSRLQEISIDYGVMEKTRSAYVVPADIGWDDVGSWDSFSRYMPKDQEGNAVHGRHVGIDSRDCIVFSERQVVATAGLSGIVVIATDDAILVMKRQKGEEVKDLVARIEEEGLTHLL
jgi:mannose-1-phosphate guanylyltransferase